MPTVITASTAGPATSRFTFEMIVSGSSTSKHLQPTTSTISIEKHSIAVRLA